MNIIHSFAASAHVLGKERIDRVPTRACTKDEGVLRRSAYGSKWREAHLSTNGLGVLGVALHNEVQHSLLMLMTKKPVDNQCS